LGKEIPLNLLLAKVEGKGQNLSPELIRILKKDLASSQRQFEQKVSKVLKSMQTTQAAL